VPISSTKCIESHSQLAKYSPFTPTTSKKEAHPVKNHANNMIFKRASMGDINILIYQSHSHWFFLLVIVVRTRRSIHSSTTSWKKKLDIMIRKFVVLCTLAC